MLIKRSEDLKYSDITPRDIYVNRRKFLYGMGLAGGLALAGTTPGGPARPLRSRDASTKLQGMSEGPFSTTEKLTPEKTLPPTTITTNSALTRIDPAKNAKNFVTSPWTVSVEGEVAKPRKFTMDEIMKLAPLEERIYRHRCVEAWSIVVPWIGYSFSTIANLVEPTPKAKFVRSRAITTRSRCHSGQAGIHCRTLKA